MKMNFKNESSMIQVKLEQQERSAEKQHVCLICLRGFKRKDNLKSHLLIHSAGTPYQCQVCFKQFQRRGYLNAHMKVHSEDRPFKCEICLKQFKRKDCLNVHMKSHSGEKPYECETCLKKFLRNSHLKEHVRIHWPEITYECKACFKPFKCKVDLNEPQEELQECSTCQDSFSTSKQHVCPTCGRKFMKKRQLDNHYTRIHSKIRPFSCNICQKGFFKKHELSNHTKVHTGLKPYVCDICEKPFAQRNDIILHLRVHSGVRPYRCSLCCQSFTQGSSLKRHLKMHAKYGLNKSYVTIEISTSQEWNNLNSEGYFGGTVKLEPNDSNPPFEKPSIKVEIKTEEVSDTQLPSCSYLNTNVKLEATDSADPNNAFDQIFIKEEKDEKSFDSSHLNPN